MVSARVNQEGSDRIRAQLRIVSLFLENLCAGMCHLNMFSENRRLDPEKTAVYPPCLNGPNCPRSAPVVHHVHNCIDRIYNAPGS